MDQIHETCGCHFQADTKRLIFCRTHCVPGYRPWFCVRVVDTRRHSDPIAFPIDTPSNRNARGRTRTQEACHRIGGGISNPKHFYGDSCGLRTACRMEDQRK